MVVLLGLSALVSILALRRVGGEGATKELRRGGSLDPLALCDLEKHSHEHRWFFKKKGLGFRV